MSGRVKFVQSHERIGTNVRLRACGTRTAARSTCTKKMSVGSSFLQFIFIQEDKCLLPDSCARVTGAVLVANRGYPPGNHALSSAYGGRASSGASDNDLSPDRRA